MDGGGAPAGWPAGTRAAAHVVVERCPLGDDLVVAGAAGHHLTRVRRLRPGEAVTAADGAGAWRLYEVAGGRSDELSLRAVGEPRREPALAPRLVVAFGLSKGSKPDVVVRGLTELGVDRILPLTTRRSVPRWGPGKAASAVSRLRRIAREAAEQSRRARLPEVGGPVGLDALAGRSGLVVAARDDPPARGGLPVPDDDPGPAGAPEWTLVVGPEGGLDAAELEVLDRAGSVERLQVGAFVLRAETAAVAAAAVLSSRRRIGLR